MMKYKQQIKEYKEEIEEKYVRAEAENKTVKACQNILSESVLSKQSHRTSYFEFLYEQTKFIKKRWWILQGCVLMCLWIWLSNYTSDIKDMMRIMGISATIFVVLIIPEIWKNRRNGAIEIEQASLLHTASDLYSKNVNVWSSGSGDRYGVFGNYISNNNTLVK